LSQLGRFSEAERYEAEALRLAEPSRYAITVAMVHDATTWCHVRRGDWATARVLNERALLAHREGNSHLTLANATAVSAYILSLLGESAEALRRLREGMDLVEGQAPQAVVVQLAGTYYWLAYASLALGRIEEAQSLADRALMYSSAQPGLAANVRQLLGDIATHPVRFDAERGEAYYRQALALAQPRGMRPVVAHCHLGLGKLYRRTGKREDAREHLTTATTMYGEMGMTFWLDKAEAEMRALA
jgi:tetratricopeptide (TPR) repeat protein